jgi:hypothetical protein
MIRWEGSVPLAHPEYQYPPKYSRWRGFVWANRFWTGAWCTVSGYIIRGYVDEVLADDVVLAKRKGRESQ